MPPALNAIWPLRAQGGPSPFRHRGLRPTGGGHQHGWSMAVYGDASSHGCRQARHRNSARPSGRSGAGRAAFGLVPGPAYCRQVRPPDVARSRTDLGLAGSSHSFAGA